MDARSNAQMRGGVASAAGRSKTDVVELSYSQRRILFAIRRGCTTVEEIATALDVPEGFVERRLQELAGMVGASSTEEFIMSGYTTAVPIGRPSRSEKGKRRRPEGPPPLVGDVEGQSTEPDPGQADTPKEFVALLRAFWEWAGRYSVRDLAAWSGEAFSRTTVADLLAVAPRKRPPVTLEYVQGLVRACGGRDDHLRRWTTAWRRVYLEMPGTSAGSAGEVIALPNRVASG